jgi:tRNA A37 N6-isopentenylltransferase MiaA
MEISKDITESLVTQYGEAATKAKAALILGRHPTTIRQMLDDGRLTACCGGSMVYVRSIAEYIKAPRLAEHEARVRRRIRDGKGRFMV